MICALVEQGKRIGVTATSHKVIRNLLDRVAAEAAASGIAVKLAHKTGEAEEEDPAANSSVVEVKTNRDALELLGDAALPMCLVEPLGFGLARSWLRRSTYCLLTRRARCPWQTCWPFPKPQGASCCSAIRSSLTSRRRAPPRRRERLRPPTYLGEHQTIPPDCGIFLPSPATSRRAFVSLPQRCFTRGRLTAKPGLEKQQLIGGPFTGSGLWVVEVDHDGNRNASDEEVEAVADLVEKLTAPGSKWIDENGVAKHDDRRPDSRRRTLQRAREPSERPGEGHPPTRIGTVDKFQGQQAPVVIYSMATSRPEEAPRGLEFLYSLNRLNVATSRAQCAVILVASPHLFVPECSTPRQMKLANALCRYRELAALTPAQRS